MKNLLLLSFVLVSPFIYAQKKDKIKGSKIVTIQQKKIESFTGIEVSDNLEIMLVKGDECAIEIEADDNLHDVIDFSLSGSTLRLSTLKEVISSKKLSVRLTYTNDFKLVIAKGESQVTALTDIDLEDITFQAYDYATLFMNAKTNTFSLDCNDKSKVELKLNSEKSRINLSKNASLKAWITAKEMTFDMYQKSNAAIEGDVNDLKLRLDNNASFSGKNLSAQNASVVTEGYTNGTVNVLQNLVIDASVKSEIEIYGEPKIEIRRFADSAVLKKRPVK